MIGQGLLAGLGHCVDSSGRSGRLLPLALCRQQVESGTAHFPIKVPPRSDSPAQGKAEFGGLSLRFPVSFRDRTTFQSTRFLLCPANPIPLRSGRESGSRLPGAGGASIQGRHFPSQASRASRNSPPASTCSQWPRSGMDMKSARPLGSAS